ncbi:MAG: hypothetical protein H7323_10385, partial [Frankiales bacterium]|nr:hypothetical protein [Frankiales bacterium]
MSRRTSLPGASELFRSTGDGAGQAAGSAAPARGAVHLSAPARPGGDVVLEQGPSAQDNAAQTGPGGAATVRSARRRVAADAERRPTGRERHDEKITVYISPEELMDLERARLTLRGEHGLAVDRGRIVREALALVLADLEARGE